MAGEAAVLQERGRAAHRRPAGRAVLRAEKACRPSAATSAAACAEDAGVAAAGEWLADLLRGVSPGWEVRQGPEDAEVTSGAPVSLGAPSPLRRTERPARRRTGKEETEMEMETRERK